MAMMKTSIVLLVLVVTLVQSRIPSPRLEPKALAQDVDEDLEDEYFEEKRKRANFYIKNTADHFCHFTGYVPSGKINSVAFIKPSKETLEALNYMNAIIAGPAKKLGVTVAPVAVPKMNLPSALMSIAPRLASALGKIVAITGTIEVETAKDLVASAEAAIMDGVVKDTKDRFTDMKNYVDLEKTNIFKDRTSVEYLHMLSLITNCLKEVSESKVVECVMDAAQYIVNVRPLFATIELDGSYTEGQVKELELGLLPFRNYANAVVLVLTPLIEYYCVDKKTAKNAAMCKTYSDQLKEESDFMIKYVTDAVAAIKKFQTGRCSSTVKCKSKKLTEGFWLLASHTVNNYDCGCVSGMDDFSKCQIMFDIRVDGSNGAYTKTSYPQIKSKDYVKAGETYGRALLLKMEKEKEAKKFPIMDKYWKVEVLDFIPTWRKAGEMAEAAKKNNPQSDAKPEYAARLSLVDGEVVDMEWV